MDKGLECEKSKGFFCVRRKERIAGQQMCAVEGCGEKRKYRWVKDWTVGACGMGHLKLLDAGGASVRVGV